MEENERPPVHDESNLLDSPDYWLEAADEVIDHLNLEIQILKNENFDLKRQLDKYQTSFVALGLEIDKATIQTKSSSQG